MITGSEQILKSVLQICGVSTLFSCSIFNKFQCLEFIDVIMQLDQFEDLSL